MSAVMEDDAGTLVPLELNPKLDLERLGADFSRHHRLRIADFLDVRGALALHQHLNGDPGWKAVLAADGRLHAASPARAGYSPEFERKLLQRAYEGTTRGFSYLYETNRLFPEDVPHGAQPEKSSRDPLLMRLSKFLNSPTFLSAARTITGLPDLWRADIQATRYRPGHFATIHATQYAAKGGTPRVIFDLNLTVEWTVEWGGLLSFNGDAGYVAEAYVPSFNVLDIFVIPRDHWVSVVAPFATGNRLAISGRLYTV